MLRFGDGISPAVPAGVLAAAVARHRGSAFNEQPQHKGPRLGHQPGDLRAPAAASITGPVHQGWTGIALVDAGIRGAALELFAANRVTTIAGRICVRNSQFQQEPKRRVPRPLHALGIIHPKTAFEFNHRITLTDIHHQIGGRCRSEPSERLGGCRIRARASISLRAPLQLHEPYIQPTSQSHQHGQCTVPGSIR